MRFGIILVISTPMVRLCETYDTQLTAKDELLNRIWYAGAYTNQLCTIDPKYGDALIHIFKINSSISDATNVTWYNNYTIANGSSALVDGAKRDRIVWAGGELQS